MIPLNHTLAFSITCAKPLLFAKLTYSSTPRPRYGLSAASAVPFFLFCGTGWSDRLVSAAPVPAATSGLEVCGCLGIDAGGVGALAPWLLGAPPAFSPPSPVACCLLRSLSALRRWHAPEGRRLCRRLTLLRRDPDQGGAGGVVS